MEKDPICAADRGLCSSQTPTLFLTKKFTLRQRALQRGKDFSQISALTCPAERHFISHLCWGKVHVAVYPVFESHSLVVSKIHIFMQLISRIPFIWQNWNCIHGAAPPSPPDHPRQLWFYTPSLWTWLLQILYVSGIRQYWSFWDWLVFLGWISPFVQHFLLWAFPSVLRRDQS